MQVYELNPENFSDLDEEDLQQERINIINPNESKNKVNNNNKKFALVVEEEILENSLVKSSEEINMILEESHDISHFKPLDSPPIMLDIQHVIGLKQHVECHIRHHGNLFFFFLKKNRFIASCSYKKNVLFEKSPPSIMITRNPNRSIEILWYKISYLKRKILSPLKCFI